MSIEIKKVFKIGEDSMMIVSEPLGDVEIGDKLEIAGKIHKLKGFPVDNIEQTDFLVSGTVNVGDEVKILDE